MPNLLHRLPQNVPGRYYVDDSCIDCDLCRSLAPDFFTRHDESGYSYVHRQPTTSAEIAQAEEALQSCPSETIGRDGAPSAISAESHY